MNDAILSVGISIKSSSSVNDSSFEIKVKDFGGSDNHHRSEQLGKTIGQVIKGVQMSMANELDVPMILRSIEKEIK